jgi:hypothetical protein
MQHFGWNRLRAEGLGEFGEAFYDVHVRVLRIHQTGALKLANAYALLNAPYQKPDLVKTVW